MNKTLIAEVIQLKRLQLLKLRIDIKAPNEVAPSMAMAIEKYLKVTLLQIHPYVHQISY